MGDENKLRPSYFRNDDEALPENDLFENNFAKNTWQKQEAEASIRS